MGVLLAYAGTMWQVQTFERNLALLVLALESKAKVRTFKSPEHFRDAIGKQIIRHVNTLHKASARQLRNRLPEGFDPELLAEIEKLLDWRDRLAHRYLLEQTRVGEGVVPGLKPEAFVELMQLSNAFQAMSVTLYNRMLERLAELPKSEVPDGIRELFDRLARAMMLGEEFTPPGSAS